MAGAIPEGSRMITRRTLIRGLAGAALSSLAAPAIVRAASLMPVRRILPPEQLAWFLDNPATDSLGPFPQTMRQKYYRMVMLTGAELYGSHGL